MLEPGRKFPGVEKLRRLAYEDLDQALLKCLEHTIFYVINKGRLLHPLTVEARNELLAEKLKLGRG
jgi:HD superfamily phosphohydrolase YqeK